MPSKQTDTTPAGILAAEAKALADEAKLNVFLDRIIKAEQASSAARNEIRDTWNAVRRAGFDIPEARLKLVRRVCAG